MDNFINQIKETLQDFTFDGENTFTKEIQHRSPGHVLIVNNQKVQTPQSINNFKFQVELFGEGEVDGNPFMMIHFSVYEDSHKLRELFESFYINEIEKFKSVLIQIFKL